MKSLEIALEKKTEPIKQTIRIQKELKKINSYSDMIGNAAVYPPISETTSKVYKLNYIDDIKKLKMQM